MNGYSNKNSDMLIKIFVHQIGLTVFGFLLYSAATVSGNVSLKLVFGIFSALFYMFLLYTMAWDKGASDIIRVNGGRAAYAPLKGLKVSLLANIPNFLLATASTVGYIFISDKSALADSTAKVLPEWAANLYTVAQVVGVYINMMYTGIADYLDMISAPYLVYIFAVPSVLACSLGYYLGTKEKFGLPSSLGNAGR